MAGISWVLADSEQKKICAYNITSGMGSYIMWRTQEEEDRRKKSQEDNSCETIIITMKKSPLMLASSADIAPALVVTLIASPFAIHHPPQFISLARTHEKPRLYNSFLYPRVSALCAAVQLTFRSCVRRLFHLVPQKDIQIYTPRAFQRNSQHTIICLFAIS